LIPLLVARIERERGQWEVSAGSAEAEEVVLEEEEEEVEEEVVAVAAVVPALMSDGAQE
jgi:hypothetical protein